MHYYSFNEKLNCRSLESCFPNTFPEILPLEFRLLSSKWLVLGTYKPPSENKAIYISEIQKILIYYRSSYHNILLLRSINMSFSYKNMKNLCGIFELNHLIKDPTCFKSLNLSFIDNFYSNKKASFFNLSLVETDLLITMVWFIQCFAQHFVKVQQIYCRSSNNYNKEQFQNVLKKEISQHK